MWPVIHQSHQFLIKLRPKTSKFPLSVNLFWWKWHHLLKFAQNVENLEKNGPIHEPKFVKQKGVIDISVRAGFAAHVCGTSLYFLYKYPHRASGLCQFLQQGSDGLNTSSILIMLKIEWYFCKCISKKYKFKKNGTQVPSLRKRVKSALKRIRTIPIVVTTTPISVTTTPILQKRRVIPHWQQSNYSKSDSFSNKSEKLIINVWQNWLRDNPPPKKHTVVHHVTPWESKTYLFSELYLLSSIFHSFWSGWSSLIF